MGRELEHLLKTYSDHEVISEQSALRDLLTCLRGLAEELQLDFEKALTDPAEVIEGGSSYAGDDGHEGRGILRPEFDRAALVDPGPPRLA
jgi:hypothetical protein